MDTTTLQNILENHRAYINSVGKVGCRANLKNADLANTCFIYENLSGANLQGADLRCCSFWCVDLSGANLENADLTSADLAGAKLTGANLKGVKGLASAETEMRVLKFIQDEIVSKGKLDMGDWHGDDDWREHPCNTTHCAAGSAQVYALLHGMPEAELQPEIVGSMLIPSVAHLFFATEEEFIEELELLLSGKKELLKR